MGCTYNAYTILGLRIHLPPFREAYTKANTRTHRGCDHDVPEAQKFCGQCGAEREVTVEPKLYTGDFQMEIEKRNPGIRVVFNYGESPSYMFIGFVGEASEDDSVGTRFEMPDREKIEALKNSLRAAFIPFGVWDPRQFGVWTVQYVGC